MADVKISQLPNASALDGTEQIPAVQGGNTVKATVNQIKTKVIGSGDTALVEKQYINGKNVIAGNGLTGGGTLATDITINVDSTDDSIVVGADGIKVDTQNTFTSTSATKPLSAGKGKELNDNLVLLSSDLSEIEQELFNIIKINENWPNTEPCVLMANTEYIITNIGDSTITIFQIYGNNSNLLDITGFPQGGLAPFQSSIITITCDSGTARIFSGGYSGSLEIKTKENVVDSINLLKKNSVIYDEIQYSQYIVITGDVGWTPLYSYKLYVGNTYTVKNIGSSYVNYVTGLISTRLNVGESIDVIAEQGLNNIRVYFESHEGKVLIYNKSAKTSGFILDNLQNEKEIEDVQSLECSGGWSDFLAYDMKTGTHYKLIYSGTGSITNFSPSGAEALGFTTLSNGNSSCIIRVNNNANSFRAYFDGSGTLTIKNDDASYVKLMQSIERLKIISEGYAEKDCTRESNIIIVAKDGAQGHFSTLRDAYASITDSCFDNQYEVVVYSGVYNEMNLIPPPFTHTHGLTPNSVVITSQGIDDSSTLPVFNQLGTSSKLSNMRIVSYNGYCIHFDNSLNGQVIVNENLILDKQGANNQWSIIGGGSFKYGTKYIWKNCVFISKEHGGASCHTNANAICENTHLIFEACTFVNCNPRNGNVGGYGNCVYELKNCVFNVGEIGLESWTSPLRNIEDATIYKFKEAEWQIIGGGNKNLSMWQHLTGRTIGLKANYPITISGTAAPIIFGYNPFVNNTKTARIDCYVISEYYINDTQAGLEPYSTPKDVYQLWKRLGDCSTTNKTLTVVVNGVTRTYTFTENYDSTKPSQSVILSAMQSILDNVTIEAITDIGFGYDNVNTSDIIMQKVTSPDVLKGEFVTISGAKATSSTALKDIVGVACEDKPINEYVKIWTSAFRFDTDYADGEYGLDANGALDASAVNKIGFVKGYNFYLYK